MNRPMAELANIKMNVNGRDVDVKTEPDRSLLEVLREDLVLTGTKYGCGEGSCGACSVLVDGKKTFSCSTPVSQVSGMSVTTNRRTGQGRQSSSSAGGVSSDERIPVRILHAGDDHGDDRVARNDAGSVRRAGV